MKFNDALELTMQAYRNNSAPTSAHTYRWHEQKVLKWFGGQDVEAICRADIQKLVWERKEQGLAPASIKHEISFLSQVFKTAIDAGNLQANPCQGVRRPQINNKRNRVLTADEEARWRATMTAKEWSLVEFAIHTGLRRLEVFRLKRDDIQFGTRPIGGQVQETGLARIGTSKTGKERTQALNPAAARVVRAWLAEHPGSEYVFYPDCKSNRMHVADRVTSDLIARARGVGIEGLVWHSLRHTAACRALRAGASLRDVQRFLGHSSVTMTERYLCFTEEDTWTAALALTEPKKMPPSVIPQEPGATSSAPVERPRALSVIEVIRRARTAAGTGL